MKKMNLNLGFLILIISILPSNVLASPQNGTTDDFIWTYDEVEYNEITGGVPANIKFKRLEIIVGNGSAQSPLSFTVHMANETDNILTGRFFQTIVFYDNNGDEWHITLHKDSFRIDQLNIVWFDGYTDISYINSHPEQYLNSPSGVSKFTINPPKEVVNIEGLTELTWSVTSYLIIGQSNETNISWNKNISIACTHRWHFFVKDNYGHIKIDVKFHDLYVHPERQGSFVNFENSTLSSEWHIGVLTTSILTPEGYNKRPDAYVIDGVNYTEPTQISAGNNVTIEFEGKSLSQIDLGKDFNINGDVTKSITTKILIVEETGDIAAPEKDTGLSMRFIQMFPHLNYSSFNFLTMDPEIKVPLVNIPLGSIPLGNAFLVLTVISATCLVVLMKKRVTIRS